MNRNAFAMTAGLLISALLSAPAGFAGSAGTLLDLVPPEAKILYGVNVQKALASPFGQMVYKNAVARSSALSRYGAAAGLDLSRDVSEVLFIATDAAGSGKLGQYDLVLARGNFRPDRFLTLASLTGSTMTQEHGLQIITPPARTMRSSIVFLDATTAMLGPFDTLRPLVARGAAKTAAPSALTQRALAARAVNDVWFATATPFSSLGLGARWPIIGAALDPIRESSGGMKFAGASAILSAEAFTSSEAAAQTIAGALKLAAQLIHNVRTAPLSKAEFNGSGSTVQARVELKEAELERLLVRPAAPKVY